MSLRRTIAVSMVSVLTGGLLQTAPVPAQSLSQGLSQGQAPSKQQIEQFCASYGQLSGSQRKQYRSQYEEYCEREPLQPETTIMQPAEPLTGQQPQEQAQEPEPESEEPAREPEPEIQPAKPEPVIPQPGPARVDLAGELRLDGPLARQAGERQRFRVTVMNRGEDPARGGRLWAEVFLSERDVSRRRGSAFSLPAVQRGQQVRIPDIPSPGQARGVMAQVTVPATVEAGRYWWCVRVDSRHAVQEIDEGNNIACARKVVALGKESESELSGLFGVKVDELKSNQAVSNETGPANLGTVIASLPANIKPAIERMNTLFVNGSLNPVPVAEGGTANVVWSDSIEDLPAAEQPEGLWLLVSEDHLGPMDCVGDPGTRFREHPDAALMDTDGSPISLSLDGRHYEPGAEYHVMGCYWRDGSFSGEWTNSVSFLYGEWSFADLFGDAGGTLLAMRPDLVVTDVLLVRGGDNRGSLIIPFRDRAAVGSRETPPGTLHYWVYVLPTTTAAGLSSYGDVAGHPDVIAATSGVTRIHEGATGGIIMTDPVVPDGASRVEEIESEGRTSTRYYGHTVFVAIGQSPFGPYSIEGGNAYAESNYDNNDYVKEFFQAGQVAEDNILDLQVKEFRSDWVKVVVRYNLASSYHGRIRMVLETVDGAPESTTMKCSGGGTGVPAERGANEEVELECFPVATSGGPFVTDTAQISLLAYRGPDDWEGVKSRAFPLSRGWRPSEDNHSELARDLIPSILSSDYYGSQTVRVRFANAGLYGENEPFRVEKRTRWLSASDCSWSESGAASRRPSMRRYIDLEVRLPVAPSPDISAQERDLDIGPYGPGNCDNFLDRISPSAIRAEVYVRVTADPEDVVEESGEHNNTATKILRTCDSDDQPGLTGSGVSARNVFRALGIPIPEDHVDRGGLEPGC